MPLAIHHSHQTKIRSHLGSSEYANSLLSSGSGAIVQPSHMLSLIRLANCKKKRIHRPVLNVVSVALMHIAFLFLSESGELL